MALCVAIQPREARKDVIGERQLTLWVADLQQAPHRTATKDDPVHIGAGAVHADVVQRRERLGTDEVDGAQVENQLFGNAGMTLHEAAQRPAVDGVDLADGSDGGPGR